MSFNRNARGFIKMGMMALILVLTMGLLATGCSTTKTTGTETKTEATTEATTEAATEAVTAEQPKLDGIPTDRPVATITMSTGETIAIALYPEFAPNTVNNFIELAEAKFYDGVIFHRIIKDFMIQGGDPDGTGMGGPGYGIPGEFASNGFENGLKHGPGVISMARSQAPDSAGSQFFICHGETSFLDGEYATFGVVAEGMEVVNQLANVKTGAEDRPVEDVVMKSITIERNGYTFDAVKKVGQ